MRFKRLS